MQAALTGRQHQGGSYLLVYDKVLDHIEELEHLVPEGGKKTAEGIAEGTRHVRLEGGGEV